MTVQLDVTCTSCGNQDEAVVEIPDNTFNMLSPEKPLKAKAKVRECLLCVRPLVLAK